MPLNILQIMTPSKIAGAERSATSLCEHLQNAGHRVVIGCKLGSPLIDAMKSIGLDVRPLGISGKLNPAGAARIARLAREIRADVIHTQLSSAAWHGSFAGRRLGIPVISHVRALNRPFLYRRATRVIAVSHEVKRNLVRQGMNAAMIDVVYNAVDPERYYLPCSRSEARSRIGVPGDATLIGVVAHLTAKKGHAYFLKSFARAAARRPGLFTLFLGDGVERSALEEQVRLLGLESRVIFAGFQPDVLTYYAAMDMVVLPSIAMEGLGRALLESGLLYRPAIGTRVGGTPEVIKDQETGFVVPPGDVDALADRIGTLADDPDLRERMGRSAHERIRETFSVPVMLEGTLETYRRAGVRSDAF